MINVVTITEKIRSQKQAFLGVQQFLFHKRTLVVKEYEMPFKIQSSHKVFQRKNNWKETMSKVEKGNRKLAWLNKVQKQNRYSKQNGLMINMQNLLSQSL